MTIKKNLQVVIDIFARKDEIYARFWIKINDVILTLKRSGVCFIIDVNRVFRENEIIRILVVCGFLKWNGAFVFSEIRPQHMLGKIIKH